MTVLHYAYVIVCLFHCLTLLYYSVCITALMCNVIMLTCCFCCWNKFNSISSTELVRIYFLLQDTALHDVYYNCNRTRMKTNSEHLFPFCLSPSRYFVWFSCQTRRTKATKTARRIPTGRKARRNPTRNRAATTLTSVRPAATPPSTTTRVRCGRSDWTSRRRWARRSDWRNCWIRSWTCYRRRRRWSCRGWRQPKMNWRHSRWGEGLGGMGYLKRCGSVRGGRIRCASVRGDHINCAIVKIGIMTGGLIRGDITRNEHIRGGVVRGDIIRCDLISVDLIRDIFKLGKLIRGDLIRCYRVRGWLLKAKI